MRFVEVANLEDEIITVLVSKLVIKLLVPRRLQRPVDDLRLRLGVRSVDDLESAERIRLAVEVHRRQAASTENLDRQPWLHHRHPIDCDLDFEERYAAPRRIWSEHLHGERRVEDAIAVELRARKHRLRDQLVAVALVPIVKMEEQAVAWLLLV